jgi:hypothetical protein
MDFSNNVHVIAENNQWSVRQSHKPLALSMHGSRADAVLIARQMARTLCCQLIVHADSGTVEFREDFRATPVA